MSWGRKVTRLAQRAAFGSTVATIEDANTGEVLRRFVLPRQPSGRPSALSVRYKLLWDRFVDETVDGFWWGDDPPRRSPYRSMSDLPGATGVTR